MIKSGCSEREQFQVPAMLKVLTFKGVASFCRISGPGKLGKGFLEELEEKKSRSMDEKNVSGREDPLG